MRRLELSFAKSLVVGVIIALVLVAGVNFLPTLYGTHFVGNGETTTRSGNSVGLCSELFAFATFQGYGFSDIAGRQFSMKPGSTAYLNITYEQMTIPASEVFKNSTAYFDPINSVYELNGSAQPAQVSSLEVGIKGNPINVTELGNRSLAVIYAITTYPTSRQGTYLLSFWSVCPLPLLTIGSTIYSGPYDSNETFY